MSVNVIWFFKNISISYLSIFSLHEMSLLFNFFQNVLIKKDLTFVS